VTLGRSRRFGSERRSARRNPVNQVFLHGKAMTGSLPVDHKVAAICIDVSATGCRVLGTGRQLLADDVVQLSFPPHVLVPLQARVVRVERLDGSRWEAGLRFEPLSSRERGRIGDWQEWWSRRRAGRRVAVGEVEDPRLEALNRAVAEARTNVLRPTGEPIGSDR
jgi:hypothetical protein